MLSCKLPKILILFVIFQSTFLIFWNVFQHKAERIWHFAMQNHNFVSKRKKEAERFWKIKKKKKKLPKPALAIAHRVICGQQRWGGQRPDQER